MSRVFLVAVFALSVFWLGATQSLAADYLSVIGAYQAGTALRVVYMGNSVGCGSCTDNWQSLTYQTNWMLTPTSRVDTLVPSAAIQLMTFLKAANSQSEMLNYSGSGWTAAMHLNNEGYDNVGAILALNPRPDMVIIPLVINDARPSNETTPAMYSANLSTIVQRFLDGGIVPVLVKENDVTPAETPDLAAYLAVVDTVAAAKGIHVIDAYTPFHSAVIAAGGYQQSGLYYTDSMHPKRAGHNLLFQQYANFFNTAVSPPLTAKSAATASAAFR